MKRIPFVLLAALLLAGCSSRKASAPTATPAPTAPPAATAEPVATPEPVVEATPESSAAPTAEPTETPAPTPAPPVKSGEYRFESEEYGVWEIHIKDNGTFSVIAPDRIYNGEGWSDNGDGSVSLGGTEAAGAAPFFDEFGSSVWRIDGDRCEPCL